MKMNVMDCVWFNESKWGISSLFPSFLYWNTSIVYVMLIQLQNSGSENGHRSSLGRENETIEKKWGENMRRMRSRNAKNPLDYQNLSRSLTFYL